MISILLTGIVLGLSAGLAPGPLLTLVITQTLKHNLMAGIKVALAPLITDFPIILISVFLLTKLTNSNLVLGIISIAGAIFVFFIAVETLSAKSIDVTLQNKPSQSFTKGILANALSPHPYLFWISIGSPIITKAMEISIFNAILFLLGFYFFLIGSKVVLAIVVSRTKVAITSAFYRYTMRFLGLALIVLAIIMLVDGFKLLGVLMFA